MKISKNKQVLLLLLCASTVLTFTLHAVYSRRDNSQNLDLEKTVVECESGKQYTGEYLIENGLNWQLIKGKLFYKGEELQRLCDPSLQMYDYNVEPNYKILSGNQI